MNKKIAKRALLVALIVGSLLNLINQWDVINGAAANWGALLFTYCVPFIVSYFSGVMANQAPAANSNISKQPPAETALIQINQSLSEIGQKLRCSINDTGDYETLANNAKETIEDLQTQQQALLAVIKSSKPSQ
ncbi:nitrate/nitrite transporter NrtS [Agarivorans sp. Toyoura001]|uniref:nitrate/nitrite transporter NrtS n=1 Tax=unclassified Agarivorans TaxID=2636026 RepID=UPI0010D741A6|nr:nitrate/nitrite transporter NrtS [Agarivorans sp. Toyoura001]GDY27431.1 hypothetical protein AHAT_33210 [Agarivorans sp. Toyoura001]